MKKDHVEMELKFLKSQMNPHMLFNNLNTIYASSIDKPEDTPELILMLSDNLKHVLYESNAETISLEKEINFIDNYISFQKIRTEGIKQINYKKAITSSQRLIAPLLLITLIENAFKHSSPNSEIIISISEKDGVLECTCINEFNKEHDTLKEQQIGLKNLEKQLNLLYKDRHTLTVKKNGKYTVNLKLALS